MKPPITVSHQDLERLEQLLHALPPSLSASRNALLEELDRADIVDSGQVPPSIVTMNSTVRFAIEARNEEFCLTLAYPKDDGQGAETISVLSPVGMALLGMATGECIDWPRPDGQLLRIRILDVTRQGAG